MEYKTGYFANTKKYLELGYYPVSIARYNPSRVKYLQWLRVSPDKSLLNSYKNGAISEIEFEFNYTLQLQSCDLLKDLDYLNKTITNFNKEYRGVIFLCYEKVGTFCHRHILSEYLSSRFNISIEELVVN